MYSHADLTREIDQIILDLEASDAPRMHPDWITQSVLALHPDIEGEDTDFYVCTGRAQVRAAVRQRLNRYKVEPSVAADAQIVLAGFERLQKHYLVDEGGAQVAVLVHAMTDEQLEQKANELRTMGAGCFQHADEIDRYRSKRRQAA